MTEAFFSFSSGNNFDRGKEAYLFMDWGPKRGDNYKAADTVLISMFCWLWHWTETLSNSLRTEKTPLDMTLWTGWKDTALPRKGT